MTSAILNKTISSDFLLLAWGIQTYAWNFGYV
jgi:hypothetical protein